MDKLELKHLAPYLPYDLKLIGKNWDYKIIQFDMECGQSSGGVNINSVDGEIFKPILRPLSDLTEEIEIDGKKFIPIYELFNIEYKGTDHTEGIRNMYHTQTGRFISSSHYNTAESTSFNILYLENNNYWKMQKLIEWHFDLDNLILNNLAVNINTLTK